MKSSWWYRFSLMMLVLLVAIMVSLPTFLNFNPEGKYPFKSKVNLGLDLQGGLYMVLGINFNNVYRDEIKTYIRKFEYTLKDIGIESSVGDVIVSDPIDPKHTLIINKKEDVSKAKDRIREYFGEVVRLTGEKDNVLEYGLNMTLRTRIEEQAVSKSIEVIRNRIDEFGVTEPEIISQGKDRILVQLPGIKDIERAKDLIGKTARLEFKLVNDEVNPANLSTLVAKAEASGIKFEKGTRFSDYVNKINTFLKNDLPKNFEIAFQKKANTQTNELESKEPYLVEAVAQITGDDLEDAGVQIDQQKNQPYVSMTLKTQGAKRFEELTGNNKGKRLAVILDGNVYTAPNINERIGGGRAQITLGHGDYNKILREAKDIALVLRAGALPVPLDFEEQRVVGPSLGQDSIKQANVAGLISCLAVFLFAIFYYRFSGVIAVGTLVLNLLFIFATLIIFDATLTLPGIAGIVLTIGMAVDSNILVHERIREEIRRGQHNFKAMQAGFEHAFWTIVDVHVTTALSALCLLNFGTGPIRGFALTLLIGVVSTVYCSFFVSRVFFDLYLTRVSGRDLSI
ncbi:MAG: protein translocase subunit SecD [Oligoflexia bacterium]|nr:protein translocase subunit SecD [Oligoflexia bacterium]